jgi:ABC-type transport system involved in cytochrome bd biosynthesis fused ATPase/permease subunit
MAPKAYTPRETAKRFLENGRIVEHGNHDNPMAQGRHYRQLHELKPGRHEAGELT